MPRMMYQCCYGSAPGPDGVGRIAMYEVHDLAGDRVETGFGETVYESATDAVAEAMTLGRDAIDRLQKGTIAPNLRGM